MALNFLQKSILRINPSLILNTRVFPEISEDALDFVLSRGFDFRQIPQDRFPEVITNKAFVNELLSLDDQEFINFVNNNIELMHSIPNKAIELDLYDRLNGIDLTTVDADSFRLLISKDSRSFIRTLKDNPDLIKNLPKDLIIEIENAHYDAVVQEINRSSLTCLDYPNNITENVRVQELFIARNPEEYLSMYDPYSLNYNKDLSVDWARDIFKVFILNDLPNNIKYLDRFQSILDPYSQAFKSDDFTAIAEEMMKQNIPVKDKSYYSLRSNTDLVLHSLLHATTASQINALKETTRYFNSIYSRYNVKERTEEQVKIAEEFADSLRRMKYIYNPDLTPTVVLTTPEAVLALIENDPYAIERMPSSVFYQNTMPQNDFYNKIVEILRRENYVFSPDTPRDILSMSPEFILDSYEMFFDRYNSIPGLNKPYDMSDEEYDKLLLREYQILKEHDPDLLTITSLYGSSNPYIVKDALARGRYTEEDIADHYFDSYYSKSPKVDIYIKQYMIAHDIKPNHDYGYGKVEVPKEAMPLRKRDIAYREKDSARFKEKELPDFSARLLPSDFAINTSMSQAEINASGKDREAAFLSAKNNIYSLYYISTDLKFTDKQLKEIAKIYLEGYPQTLENFLGMSNRAYDSFPPMIKNNPYIQYELLYNNPGRRSPLDEIGKAPYAGNSETEKLVFDSFFSKHDALSFTSSKYESNNLQIALRSIRQNPESLKFVSPRLYTNPDVYAEVMNLVAEGKYTIDKNTPPAFIGMHYYDLTEAGINVESIIEVNPRILASVRATTKIEPLVLKYIDDFKSKKISQELFIKKMGGFNRLTSYDGKNLFKALQDLCIQIPELRDELIEAQPSIVRTLSDNDAFLDEIIKQDEAFVHSIGFHSPRALFNDSTIEDYVIRDHIELIPFISYLPIYSGARLERLRSELINKINTHTLDIPDNLPEDYHFQDRFFEDMSDATYSHLIDEVIKQNPYHISMFTGTSETQDIILKSRIDRLLKEGIISFDSPQFNLPEFYARDVEQDYVVQMLKENPDLINSMKYKLPGRTPEEADFIIGTIVEHLDSKEPLPVRAISGTSYISVLLYKDMSYVANMSAYSLSRYQSDIEAFFATAQIPYSEDIPGVLRDFYRDEFKESGYPRDFGRPQGSPTFTNVPPVILEATPEQKFAFIRQHPNLASNYEFVEQLNDDGFVLREDDPIALQINYQLILSSINQDPTYIYRINPLALTASRHPDQIAEVLIKQNYQVGEELPPFLTGSPTLFIYALNQNPENAKLFDFEKMHDARLQADDADPLIDVLVNNGYYVSEKVHPALIRMPRYVFESLDKAEKPEDIKTIIDTAFTVEFSNEDKEKFYAKVLELMEEGKYKYDADSNPELDFSKEIVFKALQQDIQNIKIIAPDTSLYTVEEQMAIYELYMQNEELFVADPELMESVENNPFVKMDRAAKDVEHFDDYSFEGVYVPDEYKEKIVTTLLESGYKVSENTPKFLLLDENFLVSYISKNQSVEGVPPKFIANLFTIEKLTHNSELADIYKYCSSIMTPLSSYTSLWGVESTVELFEKYGSLIRFLDPSVQYTIESAKDDLEIFLDNNPNMDAMQLTQFYTVLEKEVTRDTFRKYPLLASTDDFIRYAIGQDPNLLFQYTGTNDELLILAKEVDPTDSYLSLENFSSSDPLLKSLIEEKGPDYVRHYTGKSDEVVNLALDKGLFVEKDEKYINDILSENKLLRENDLSIKYLIEHYSPEYIEQYLSQSPEVFQAALDAGYEVTFEKLIKHDLHRSDIMVDAGIKKDPYCHGFRYSYYTDSEKLQVLQTIIGKKAYSSIFDPKNPDKDFSNPDSRTKAEQDYLNLTTIINNPEEGAKFLKLADSKLIQSIGFNEWVKVIKYSFENEKIQFLSDAIAQDKIDGLIKFQNLVAPHIDDNQALGVNKFLTITRFYMQQGKFCDELFKEIENGKELSNIELANLETLIYRESSTEAEFVPSDLQNLISVEKERLTYSRSGDALLTFLFNIDKTEAQNILNSDINSKTISQIHTRAQRDGNEKLAVESDFMGIIVDVIENIMYNYNSQENDAIIDSILRMPDESLMKLRKSFGNIKELIRHFYEIEAQEEMVDLDILKQNPEYTTEYPGKEDGTTVKVVDISKMKHALYAHVYSGTDMSSFFNTAHGKVTICVSPETDKHEAYYYGESEDTTTRFGFTKLPTGSFIGSAPSNMGSNSNIDYNNFEVKNTRALYDQRSIRESYEEQSDGHAETLLYRQDLIPTCLIINNPPPNEFQLEIQANLQAEVRKIPGHENDEIVFVKTQGNKHRIFDYQTPEQSPAERQDISEKQKFIQTLRKEFFGLTEDQAVEVPTEPYLRRTTKGYNTSSYTIINGEVYNEVYEEQSSAATLMLTSKLESIVHKDNPDAVLDVRQVTDGAGILHTVTKEKTDSRSLWHLTRASGPLSKEANATLLKEFLVDHLMCNYSVGNNAFTLSSDNSIASNGNKSPLSHPLDFVSSEGIPYTSMSYYYYDGNKGSSNNNAQNNVYRKMFEAYIHSSNEDEIIPPEAFEEMRTAAEEIAEMPEEEYMKMFKEVLLQEPDSQKREIQESIIKARKEHIVEDTDMFIQRINRQREQAHTIEVIDSPESVALINDVHGNVSALEALLDKCEELGKKDVFILGDMIGFGAQSNECLSLIRERMDRLNIRCILGNHELYSLMGNDSFRNLSYDELNLTSRIRQDISGPNREFLEELPLARRVQIGGQMVEFTHFPMQEEFADDKDIFLPHGASFMQTQSGKSASYVIYGHEHLTEATSGNQVGSIVTHPVGDKVFINLPSSGCVHGEKTTLTLLDLQKEEGKDEELVANTVAIDYDKARNDKAIRETDNPYASHFGTRLNPEDGER